ncbi:thioredoxin-disulfide reductase [Caldanaerobius polysaccharolyticus]|uniref:thioredoxin-disulfide reductase n=1 Tax=Caldanaerobius polysaccharolyticus TaxID=44256 RepID=UPI00047E453F|nr:thioredoxin-disulfide reductase [Caldanaerobius polysaccharolyticus]
MHDLIIIGAGPAGLTAGLYAARAGMDVVLLEKMFAGGQVSTTYLVENYPGFVEPIAGPDLMANFENQARRYGLEIIYEEVQELDIAGSFKKVKTDGNTYEAKAVILAMGANPRELGLEKERKFRGAGVSYCATCDGAFYKDKVVAVVGGGNTAVEDAVFLTRFASKVYLIHRRNELRATKAEQDKAFSNEKISFIWDTVIEDIIGDQAVEGLKLRNNKTGQESQIAVDGLFVAIGTVPNSEIVKGLVAMDEYGYIITDESMKTSVEGVFAAGDVRKTPVRQIVTAAADGAIAAIMAEKYIGEIK